MLLLQPPSFGPGTGVGAPLCFDYADFDADSEVGYRFQHQHQRNPQCERERYFDEDNGIGGGKSPVIVSATMSVVDFGGGGVGGGCLGFGHGFGGGGGGGAAATTPDYAGCGTLGLGRRGSLPLAAEFGVPSTGPGTGAGMGTAPPSPLASSFFPRERGRTEDSDEHEQEHHKSLAPTRRQSTPLALFAWIKKQLSGVSVGTGERRASSDGYVSGWKEDGMGKEKEKRGSGMTAAMTMMAAMYVGADGGGSGDSRWREGDPTDVFSTTNHATKPPSTSSLSSTSAKRNQRRRRQRKHHRVSGSGTDTQHNAETDAAFSSPSVYSRSSASRRSSSFIGSSASFLELERDNMNESRDHAELMMHPQAHLPLDDDHDRDDSGYGRSFYYDGNTHTTTTTNDNENGGHDDMTSMYTANTGGTRSSAGSYVPYLPLIIQHERLQKRLRVPLSLDAVSATTMEVGSTSASVVSGESRSLASKASEVSNGGAGSSSMRSGSGSRSRERQKRGKQRSRTPRKGDAAPPPLPASSLVAPKSTPSVLPLRDVAFNTQNRSMGTPPSPTSPTSSTDTSESTRSPVTPNTPKFFGALGADHVKLEDGDVDLKRDSRSKGVHDLGHHQPSDAPGFVHSRSTGNEEKRQSILVHKDVNVNVLPPTPTTPNGFGSDGSQQQSSSTSSSPSSPPSRQSLSQSPLNRARSRSRQNLGKAPPPPSGPLPLPPQSRNPSQTPTERTKQRSPQSSFELGFPTPHRHPSPFGFHSDTGSGDTTPTTPTTVTKMLKTKAKATMTTMAMTMAKGSGGAGKEVFVDTGSELRFAIAVKDDNEDEDDAEDGVNEMILGHLYTSESDEAPSAHAYSYSCSHSHKPSSQLTPASAIVVPDTPQQIDVGIDVFALHEERLKKAAETEKIGVGRQQVRQQPRQRQRHSSRREQPQPQEQEQEQEQELEWTLCLGADASAPPAGVPLPGAAPLSSSRIVPEVTVTLSPSSSSSCSPPPPPPPLQPLSPSPTPQSPSSSSYNEPTPSQLRMRTKSESALGRKAAQGPASGQDWTLMLPLPGVPSLPTQLKPGASRSSLSSPLSSSPLPSSSSKTPTNTKERYSDPTPFALGGPFEDDTSSVDFSTDLHVPSASVDLHAHARADARIVSILDGARDDMLCVPTHGNTNAVGGRKSPNHNPNRVEEIVLCVPRLVTHASGSGSGSGSTNPRSRLSSSSRTVMPTGVLSERGWKSKPKFKDGVAPRVAFDVDVDVNDDNDPADTHHLEAPSRQPNRTRKRSSNLAKLDALSADLARFNEMLRSASASAASGVGGQGHVHHHSTSSMESGLLHGAPGVGGGVNVNAGGSAKPNANANATFPMSAKRQYQQQLKHTRSYGIIEVDEPPPPNAILRVPSVGDLFLAAEGAGTRSRADSRVRVRSDSKARVKVGKEVVEYVKDNVPMTPEDAPSRERVSMGSIVSSASSASSMSTTSRIIPSPFDAPLTPTSPSPTTPTLVAAPPKRTSVQSFTSLNSQRSRASLSSLSSTASGSTQPPPTKIRPPLPFAPPAVAFGGYAATAGRSPTSTSTPCSIGGEKNAGVGVGSNTNATSRKLSSASLSSVSSSMTTKHTAAKDEKGMRSSASTGLLRRGTTKGTGMRGENEKGSSRGRAGSLGLRVVIDSMKRVDGPGDIVRTGEEAPQTTIPTTSSPVPAHALQVDTSSLSLLSFPSNSTLRPTSSSVGSGSGSSIKSSRSSGSLTPTASPKSESKHLYPHMQLSPEEVEEDYYESESAGPTPLASSFPVPPAFPTLRSSLSTSITNTNLINEVHTGNTDANVNTNDNANDHVRPGPAAVKYHAPGTGDSTRSARTITPLHFRGLNLEERIRQLRVLGVDAGGADTPDGVGRDKERGVKEAVAMVEKEKESDDEESLCSEAYYSARSSFSSERGG